MNKSTWRERFWPGDANRPRVLALRTGYPEYSLNVQGLGFSRQLAVCSVRVAVHLVEFRLWVGHQKDCWCDDCMPF